MTAPIIKLAKLHPDYDPTDRAGGAGLHSGSSQRAAKW